MMVTAIVCHSLNYDSRVMPCSLVLPHAEVVQQAPIRVLNAIIGASSVTDTQLTQLGLPTCLGGL